VEMFYFTKPALEDSIFNRRRRVGIPSTKSILQNVCLCQFRIFIYICHDLFCVQWFDWAVLVCFVYNDLIGQYLFVLSISVESLTKWPSMFNFCFLNFITVSVTIWSTPQTNNHASY
jgi:hypothetical protein